MRPSLPRWRTRTRRSWCARRFLSWLATIAYRALLSQEVLKNQKRHLAQIERLKAKVETLTHQLTAAKVAAANAATSAPAPTLAPVQAPATAPEPASVGKKRRAPTEFDPAPTTTPRAIVATTTPRSIAPSAGATEDKENVVSTKTPSKRKGLSATTPVSANVSIAVKADEVVPLKPAAVSPVAREALKVVVGEVPAAAAPAPAQSKVEELRARLARQRASRAAASAGP